MQQNLQKKRGLVKKVFDNVYNKYDLMNDFMSLGVHRQWKRELIRQMNPYPESTLIDVACGTGDIAKLFADNTSNKSKILCVDFNKKMLDEGKKRLSNYKNINWKVSRAEKIDAPNETFDYYTISFGLRNTKNLNSTISEAYRVLKKGGTGIFQVPLNTSNKQTYEDFTITDPKERNKAFGQYDHVRVYGMDFFERLEKVGFKVEKCEYTLKLSEEEKIKYCLPKKEIIPICVK